MTLLAGDVTEQRVDAVVNAASSALRPGGGVAAASHWRGGPAIASARPLWSVPG